MAADCSTPEVCGDGVDNDGSGNPDDGCGSQQSCLLKQGPPIDLVNGIVQTVPMTDVVVRGSRGDDLVLTRVFTSQNTVLDWETPEGHPDGASARDAFIGHGWSHTFQTRLLIWPHRAVYYRPNGETVTFEHGEIDLCHARPPADRPIRISCPGANGQYRITEGVDEVFDFGADGRLTTVSDRHGVLATVAYDAQGRLFSVTNASGQSLFFKHSAQFDGYVLDRVCLDEANCSATSASVLAIYEYQDSVGRALPALHQVHLQPNTTGRRLVEYQYGGPPVITDGESCGGYTCGPNGCLGGVTELFGNLEVVWQVDPAHEDVKTPIEEFQYLQNGPCQVRGSQSATSAAYQTVGLPRQAGSDYDGPHGSGDAWPWQVSVGDGDSGTGATYYYDKNAYLPLRKQGECQCGSADTDYHWAAYPGEWPEPTRQYLQREVEKDAAHAETATTQVIDARGNSTHRVENDDDADAANGSTLAPSRQTVTLSGLETGALNLWYAFDANGSPTSLTYPSGARVTYGYSGGHPLLPSRVTLRDPGATVTRDLASGLTWHPGGADVREYVAGNGVKQTFKYGPDGVLVETKALRGSGAGTTVGDARVMARNVRGHPTQVRTYVGATAFEHTYTFDELEHVTRETIRRNGADEQDHRYVVDSHDHRVEAVDEQYGLKATHCYEGATFWSDSCSTRGVKVTSRLRKVETKAVAGHPADPRRAGLNDSLTELVRQFRQVLGAACGEGGADGSADLAEAAGRLRRRHGLGGDEFRRLLLGLPGIKAQMAAYRQQATPEARLSHACGQVVPYLDGLLAQPNLVPAESAGSVRRFTYDATGNLKTEDYVCNTHDARSPLRHVAVREELTKPRSEALVLATYDYDAQGHRVHKVTLGVKDEYYAGLRIATLGAVEGGAVDVLEGGANREGGP
jgi:YD repeat-containing protein